MFFLSILAQQEFAQTAEPTGIGPIQWTLILIVAIGIILNPWIMLFLCRYRFNECRKTRRKYWNQLLLWRNKWKEMEAWITQYQTWVANNCTCPVPDPVGDPPDPPTWPNGNGDEGGNGEPD